MKCTYCGKNMRKPFARDNSGEVCKPCWNWHYPADNPTHFIIPDWHIDGFISWMLPEGKQAYFVLCGEYDITYIDYKKNLMVFWAHIKNQVVKCKGDDSVTRFYYDVDVCYDIGINMTKFVQSARPGMTPFIVYLTEAQEFGIVYRNVEKERAKSWRSKDKDPDK